MGVYVKKGTKNNCSMNKLLSTKTLENKIPKLLVKMALNMGFFCGDILFYEILTNIRLKCRVLFFKKN